MLWVLSYFGIGLICTVIAIKTGFCERGDNLDTPPAIVMFLMWPFFVLIVAIAGAYTGGEWLFYKIADLIPNIRFKNDE